MNRGDIWEHPLRGRRFVVVATRHLLGAGTVILAEIAPEAPAGTRGMLTVQLDDRDGISGAVIAYRVNWQSAERMADWKYVGRISGATMELVDVALRAAMDL